MKKRMVRFQPEKGEVNLNTSFYHYDFLITLNEKNEIKNIHYRFRIR